MQKQRICFSISCWLLAVGCWLAVGCASRPTDVTRTNSVPAIYPDYVGVTIPAGLAPLNFAMADDAFTAIDVEVRGSKGGTLHANGSYADFDVEEWHALTQQNKGGRLTVTVCAEKDGQWLQYQGFTIDVSTYTLEAPSITYRRIPPSYEIFSRMGIYERDLSTFDEKALLVNTQLPGTCVNCHTPNRTNADQYVYHMRGAHGGTVISRGEGDELVLPARNDTLGGSMVYAYWHPDGRYCAFSTNRTAQMFHLAKNKRIEVYDDESDVFVYDTESQTIIRDTLTMKEAWAENCPAFSHDGKWLYYVTAKRQTYPKDYDKQVYSLCRVAFDKETGHLASRVDTLLQASKDSIDGIPQSVTWPRPSYDGNYIMYTRVNWGYFSIWHPEADLWLLDLRTGKERPLTEVNSPRAESLHEWSADSRWFLFTSRRDDGLYSRIYFSMIDDNGKATKPFMLPQRNPKVFYRELLDSYNTPMFKNKLTNKKI